MLFPTLLLLISLIFLLALSAVAWVYWHAKPKTLIESFERYPRQCVDAKRNTHLHGASVIALSDGRLLATWFAGSGEREAADVGIYTALSPDGISWSEHQCVQNTSGQADINPVLFQLNEHELWLFYHRVERGTWESSVLMRKSATINNSGLLWQDEQPLDLVIPADFYHRFRRSFDTFYAEAPQQAKLGRWVIGKRSIDKVIEFDMESGFNRWFLIGIYRWFLRRFQIHTQAFIEGWHDQKPKWYFPKHKHPLLADQGWQTRYPPIWIGQRIVLPVYSDHLGFSILLETDDQGQSWHANTVLAGALNIQPTIVPSAEGYLALMRDNGFPPKRILISKSDLQGTRWSTPRKCNLPSPASAAAVINYGEHDLLCIYNDSQTDRNVLALATARADQPMNWSKLCTLLADPQQSYQYPSVCWNENADLVVVFTNAQADMGQIAAIVVPLADIKQMLINKET